MMHESRRWNVTQAESLEQLARNLTEHTWTKCTGFELAGYLFLNDSTSEDGAQEYAILRKPTEPVQPYLQVESVTFGWYRLDQAEDLIRQTLRGEFDAHGQAVRPKIETPHAHGHCGNCA